MVARGRGSRVSRVRVRLDLHFAVWVSVLQITFMQLLRARSSIFE